MSIDKKSSYYDAGGIETITVIKAKLTDEQYKGYLLGNCIEYSCSLNHKGSAARDAEKIAVYSGQLKDFFEQEGPENTDFEKIKPGSFQPLNLMHHKTIPQAIESAILFIDEQLGMRTKPKLDRLKTMKSFLNNFLQEEVSQVEVDLKSAHTNQARTIANYINGLKEIKAILNLPKDSRTLRWNNAYRKIEQLLKG